MVCAYWRRPVFQGDLARWLRTTEIGTPARNLARLQEQGFDVSYLEGSLAYVTELLDAGQPCILFVRTGELSYWAVDTAHAIVLAGIDAGQAYLFDPAVQQAPQIVTVDELMLAWSGFDFAMGTLAPTQKGHSSA